MDFIGAYVPDIITDERLKDRKRATLKLMGIMGLQKFNVLGTASSRPRKGVNAPGENTVFEKGIAPSRKERKSGPESLGHKIVQRNDEESIGESTRP